MTFEYNKPQANFWDWKANDPAPVQADYNTPQYTWTYNTPQYTWTESPLTAKKKCEQHEVQSIAARGDGSVKAKCKKCSDEFVVEAGLFAGLLSGLRAEVLDRLAGVLDERDVNEALVALGELSPRVDEALGDMERILRMMRRLSDLAGVTRE